MGNLLAECQRCSINQCEVCTDVVSARLNSFQTSQSPGGGGGASRHAAGVSTQEGGRAGPGGRHQEYQPTDMSEADALQQALRMSRLEAERARRGASPGASQAFDSNGSMNSARAGPLLGEEDPTLMAAIAASYASGSPTRGGQQMSEEELVAAAIRRAKQDEDNRERARLRDEQASEYEESLRMDRQKEQEKALRLKEEEEKRQKEAAEEEAKRREEEQRLSEAEAAENARKAKAAAIIEEAVAKLLPEPAAEEPNRIKVLVRTPDGRRLKRAFRESDVIGQVYHYANSEGGEALVSQEYRLVSLMPRVVYEDREATLAEARLQDQCALLVEVIDNDE